MRLFPLKYSITYNVEKLCYDVFKVYYFICAIFYTTCLLLKKKNNLKIKIIEFHVIRCTV